MNIIRNISDLRELIKYIYIYIGIPLIQSRYYFSYNYNFNLLSILFQIF